MVENRTGHAPIGQVRDQQAVDRVEFPLEPPQCLSSLSIRSADQQFLENDCTQPQWLRIGFAATSGATRTQDKLFTVPERRYVNGGVENNGRQAASLPGETPEDVLDNDSGVDEAFRSRSCPAVSLVFRYDLIEGVLDRLRLGPGPQDFLSALDLVRIEYEMLVLPGCASHLHDSNYHVHPRR